MNDDAVLFTEVRESLVIPSTTLRIPMPQGAAVPAQSGQQAQNTANSSDQKPS